jgi:hypothetical protein
MFIRKSKKSLNRAVFWQPCVLKLTKTEGVLTIVAIAVLTIVLIGCSAYTKSMYVYNEGET